MKATPPNTGADHSVNRVLPGQNLVGAICCTGAAMMKCAAATPAEARLPKAPGGGHSAHRSRAGLQGRRAKRIRLHRRLPPGVLALRPAALLPPNGATRLPRLCPDHQDASGEKSSARPPKPSAHLTPAVTLFTWLCPEAWVRDPQACRSGRHRAPRWAPAA